METKGTTTKVRYYEKKTTIYHSLQVFVHFNFFVLVFSTG